MPKEYDILSFEGGKLQALPGRERVKECVLALPLGRFVAHMVHAAPGEDIQAVATAALAAANPFPDDALTVGVEKVSEGEGGTVAIAAAFPESTGDDLGEALDADKRSVIKIDALVFGQLRGLWSELQVGDARKLIVVRESDDWALVVMDGDHPIALRSALLGDDLRLSVLRTLLEAEDFGGARKLEEIVVVENAVVASEQQPSEGAVPEDPTASLSVFAPVRKVTCAAEAALKGVAERAAEAETLDALPASWREMLEETRFKHRMIRNLAVAGGLWALVMGVLFGVPIAYGYMTDYQKGLSKQHARQYAAVREMKEKTDIVRKYSDHARGALEIMKAVSDRLPEGIVLSLWDYKRDEGVQVSGEADGVNGVYQFKDAMTAMGTEAEGEDEAGEKVFGTVHLGGPTSTRNGQKFKLECQYAAEEEE